VPTYSLRGARVSCMPFRARRPELALIVPGMASSATIPLLPADGGSRARSGAFRPAEVLTVL
jgi:hypothetical protein